MKIKNIIKLDEDDIIEILLEHYQKEKFKSFSNSKGLLIGTPGNDLRFVGAYGNEDEFFCDSFLDLEQVDKTVDYNGDHSILKKNPQFIYQSEKKKK